jgi:ferredoxin
MRSCPRAVRHDDDRSELDRERDGAMRVVVDFDLCESNAVCMGIAPEVFEVRDDDFLYVLQEEPPEELRPKIEEAVQRCPKQAISIQET